MQRTFPHGLRIHVQERVPVAWIAVPNEDDCLILADGGVIVPGGCESRDGLIELAGLELSEETAPGTRLLDEHVADLIDRLKGDIPSIMSIRRIEVSDPSSVTLDADSGLRVLLGEIDACAQRVDALAALSRTIDLERYRLIDLRLEGEARLVTW